MKDKKIRIVLTHGSASVSPNVSKETVDMLNKLSEIAYSHPLTNKIK